ncbi:IS1 family transposase [Chitinophaga sp. GCM10012297]
MARVLKFSPGTIINYLRKISANACFSIPDESNQEYEVDEIRTFVRKNNPQYGTWIMYAINRASRKVIHFIVGRRTKNNLRALIEALQKLNPKRIHTDSLNIYPGIIQKNLHRTWIHGTNYIEKNW